MCPGFYGARHWDTPHERFSAEVIYSKSPPPESESIEQVYLTVKEKPETHPELKSPGMTGLKSRLIYRAAILAGAELCFVETRANFSFSREVSRIVAFPKKGIDPDWSAILVDFDQYALKPSKEAGGLLAIEDGKSYNGEDFPGYQESFSRHLLQTEQESIYFNPHLKFYSGHDEGLDDFFLNCHDQGKKIVEKEAGELLRKIKTRLGRMKEREQGRFRKPKAADENESSYRVLEKFDVFLTKVVNHYLTIWHDPRLTSQAQPAETGSIRKKMNLFFQNDLKNDITVELAELRDEVFQGLHKIDGRFQDIIGDVERIDIRLIEKDIDIGRFALLWVPYLEVSREGETRLLKAF